MKVHTYRKHIIGGERKKERVARSTYPTRHIFAGDRTG